MKGLLRFASTLALALALPLTAAAGEYTVEELLDATDDVTRGTSSHGKMSMQVKTDRYERTMKMEVWSRGTDDSLIRILEPAKEKGVSTLKVGDNMWNYLPKVDRTLKIAGAALSGSWMGSHISNDDLVKSSRLKDDFTYKLTAEPAEDGTGAYVIELTPNPDAPVVWGKVVVKVRHDKQPLETTYFDEKGELVRTMRFLEIKDMSGRTFPTVMRVEPADAPEEFTQIVYDEMEFDIELSDRTFSLQSLKR
jgi:outer membrane lipoprotein-sorting protein